MEEDFDMHMCLVCHRTITGLLNYVNHKKSECSGRKANKDLHDTTFQSDVNGENEIRNQGFTLGTNGLYTSQSFTATGQPSYSLSDNFARSEAAGRETVNVLNSQSGISSSLDVFDAEAQLHDICLKAYSPPTTHTAPVTHSLFDSQAVISHQQSSCDLAAFGLSPSIFTSASRHASKLRETGSSQENHGLLNACISNSVEPDFGNAVNIHIPTAYPILGSDKSPNPNGTVININEIISDSKSHANSKVATEKVDDFFQSLELMSKSNPKTDKGSSYNQPLLPISNILSNLTFSSDEEDLGFNFADDVSLDSMSENSDDNDAPPSDYTGAKWKPGERPGTNQYKSNRLVFRGKWPPGQVPEQTTAKYYGGRPKGGKNISSLLPSPKKKPKVQKQAKPSIKKFRCNFCDLEFQSRFKYSNHCGSASHKEKVFGNRDEVKETYGKGEGKSVIKKTNVTLVEDQTDPSQNNVSSLNLDVREEQPKIKFEDDLEDTAAQDEVEEGNDIADDDQEDQEGADDRSHFYTAVPLELHICTVCDRKYPNKYVISNHMLSKYHRNRAAGHKESHFALLERYHKYIARLSPYQCAICRFYFNKETFFKHHLQSEEHMTNCEELIGEMMCSLCQYKTHNHSDLLDHVNSKDHVYKLAKHRKLCVVKESHVECRCKYCGLVMRSFTRLKRHTQLKHKDRQIVTTVEKRQVGVRKQPVCCHCHKQFQSQYALQLHVRRKHSLERPFKCELCEVGFASKYDFGMHKKTSKHLQRSIDFQNNITKTINETVAQSLQTELTESQSMHAENIETPSIGIEYTKEMKSEGSQSEYDIIDTCSTVVEDIDSTVVKKEHTEMAVNEIPQPTDSDKPKRESLVVDEISDSDVDDILVEDADTDEWTPDQYEEKSEKKKKPKTKPAKIKLKPAKSEKTVRKKYRPRGEAPIKIHKCDHCSFTANSYNDLRPHYLKEHSTQIKLCEVCDLVFLSDKALKLHNLSKDHQQNITRTGSNVTEQYYTCHICKKKFTDEKYCKFHTAFQHFHLTSEDAVIAEYDGKDETRVKYKVTLDEIKPLMNSASVQCPECKNMFKKNNLIEHLRTHTGDKPYKCKMCPKTFMSSVTLRRHLLGHFGCQERTCEVCGKHFKKSCSLTAHMKIHSAQSENKGKVHKCEFCEQAFYFDHQLTAHLKRHRKREFACTHPGCHWKFVFANELKYHMRCHSEDKPFLCDICGYATISKFRLRRHHKTHTGERNYHCEYCTYKAGNPTHLHRHMRIHIGSKPFKCPYCDYTCNTQENLRKHIVQTKKHQGLLIYPCKFCEFATNKCKEFRNHLFEKHGDKIGKDLNISSLSVFTGLYDKANDPKEPEEGNRIYQVRERVHRGKSTKKSQKTKSETTDQAGLPGAKKCNTTTEYPEKKALINGPQSEPKREHQADTKSAIDIGGNKLDYAVGLEMENHARKPLNSCYIPHSSDNQLMQQNQILDISRPYYSYALNQGCMENVSNVCQSSTPPHMITVAPLAHMSGPHDSNTDYLRPQAMNMPYQHSHLEGTPKLVESKPEMFSPERNESRHLVIDMG